MPDEISPRVLVGEIKKIVRAGGLTPDPWIFNKRKQLTAQGAIIAEFGGDADGWFAAESRRLLPLALVWIERLLLSEEHLTSALGEARDALKHERERKDQNLDYCTALAKTVAEVGDVVDRFRRSQAAVKP